MNRFLIAALALSGVQACQSSTTTRPVPVEPARAAVETPEGPSVSERAGAALIWDEDASTAEVAPWKVAWAEEHVVELVNEGVQRARLQTIVENQTSLFSIRPDWDTGVRAPTSYAAESGLSSRARKKLAKSRSSAVEDLFVEAGVRFPPRRVMLVSYKLEQELEVWASEADTGPMTRVVRYGVCAASGTLGPKREEGDGQVPEGFYEIDYFNNKSAYHLAMHVTYPNRSDRILTSNPKAPGSAIMVHGDCVSAGCLAMSDERDEELWWILRSVWKRQRGIPLAIFPTRHMDSLLAVAPPELVPFWTQLAEGRDRLLEQREPVSFRVDDAGAYHFE